MMEQRGITTVPFQPLWARQHTRNPFQLDLALLDHHSSMYGQCVGKVRSALVVHASRPALFKVL